MGAAGAQRIRGEGQRDLRAGHISQLLHDLVHVGHEPAVIPLAGIALRTQQVVGTQTDHPFSPGMRFLTPKPMMEASTALMMAVGIKGSTQAVMPAATLPLVTTQNRATPTT